MSESSPARHLPGHIEAALQRNLARQHRDEQGRPADSAGVAWEGRDLSGPGIEGSANPLHAFDHDDGLTDPAWTAVLRRLASGEAEESDAVRALAGMRVFAAVVPTATEVTEHGSGGHEHDHGHDHEHGDGAGHDHGDTLHGDKAADVALVSLQSQDGRGALPVFTSVTALTDWNPQARPVAVWMPRACLSAVQEGNELVVVDPGAEVTFVVRRPAVWALGQQKPWTPAYRDEELVQELAGVVDLVPGLDRIGLAVGSGVATRTSTGAVLPGGGAGPEVQIVAFAEPGLDAADHRLMAATLQQVLADVPALAERADSVEITVHAL